MRKIVMLEPFKGVFTPSSSHFRQRLSLVKSFLFDWDGVFSNGSKGLENSSFFSEADAMGTNLLRFSYWLKNDHQLPFIGIVTGETNPVAFELAKRERFNAVYFKIKNKKIALEHINETFGLANDAVSFCFDDVLDLSVARAVGLRCLINRAASPRFTDFVRQGGFCDYITAQEGGQHAVREVTELLISCLGNYEEVMTLRWQFDPLYMAYLEQRQQTPLQYFSVESSGGIDRVEAV